MYRPPEEYYVHVDYVISYIVSSSCNLYLNKSTVGEDIASSGRLFQILIDEG